MPQGWKPILRKDLSFTIGLPPDAQIMEIPKELMEGAGGGSGLGGVLSRASGSEKDGNGFIALIGNPSAAALSGTMSIAAFAEGSAEGKSPERIADEIEDAVDAEMPFESTVSRKTFPLPVGDALRIRADIHDLAGQPASLIFYILVDSPKAYMAMFFNIGPIGGETGLSPREIMKTFRVRR